MSWQYSQQRNRLHHRNAVGKLKFNCTIYLKNVKYLNFHIFLLGMVTILQLPLILGSEKSFVMRQKIVLHLSFNIFLLRLLHSHSMWKIHVLLTKFNLNKLPSGFSILVFNLRDEKNEKKILCLGTLVLPIKDSWSVLF